MQTQPDIQSVQPNINSPESMIAGRDVGQDGDVSPLPMATLDDSRYGVGTPSPSVYSPFSPSKLIGNASVSDLPPSGDPIHGTVSTNTTCGEWNVNHCDKHSA